MTPSDKNIRQFWLWFGNIAESLARAPTDRLLLEQLDRRVTSFGDIAWEIGPGLRADWALVLSPQGNGDLLRTTNDIVSAAPEVSGWEFHPAIPSKIGWNLEFDLTVSDLALHLNATGWTYVLLRFPDNTFDIIVFAHELRELEESAARIALRIVLDGILGESARMDHLHRIEVATEEDEGRYPRRIGIARLADHVRSLRSS